MTSTAEELVSGAIGILIGVLILLPLMGVLHWRFPVSGNWKDYPWNWRLLVPWPPLYYNWLERTRG